jgi:Glycosyltransferase family 87
VSTDVEHSPDPDGGRSGLRSPVAAVVAVLAGLVALASGLRALLPAIEVAQPTAANEALVQQQDFRDALYYPIQEFLAGRDPYLPQAMLDNWPVRQTFNLYQPYHLVLHMPFGLLPYRAGAIAFAVVLLLLTVLLAALAAIELRRFVPVPVLAGTAVVAALLLSSQLGKAQLYLGQINPEIAVAVAAALMLRFRHPAWAAFAVGLVWIKPQYGAPLVALLMVRGSWKVALGGTGIAAVASLPVVGVLIAHDGGPGRFVEVIRANLDWAEQTTYGAVDSPIAERVDVAAVWFRVTGLLPPAAELLALVVVMVVSALLVRALDRTGDDGDHVLADLLTGLAVVVAVVHQPGDILIAVPAAVGVAGWWWRHRADRPTWAVPVLLVLFAFPFAHIFAVDTVIRSAFGEHVALTVDGVATVLAWLVLVVLSVIRSRRSAARRPEVAVT